MKKYPVISVTSSDWKGRVNIQHPEPIIRFSLTYEVVMCKQHSAVFPNQVSSFNPKKRERGFEMVHGCPKTPLL